MGASFGPHLVSDKSFLGEDPSWSEPLAMGSSVLDMTVIFLIPIVHNIKTLTTKLIGKGTITVAYEGEPNVQLLFIISSSHHSVAHRRTDLRVPFAFVDLDNGSHIGAMENVKKWISMTWHTHGPAAGDPSVIALIKMKCILSSQLMTMLKLTFIVAVCLWHGLHDAGAGCRHQINICIKHCNEKIAERTLELRRLIFKIKSKYYAVCHMQIFGYLEISSIDARWILLRHLAKPFAINGELCTNCYTLLLHLITTESNRIHARHFIMHSELASRTEWQQQVSEIVN